VQFALDVDQAGGLIFPATEFVFGVRRVYVRFAYQEMGDAQELISRWYLNDNPVSSSALAWDGGGEGEYVMWMEDPDGLGRGQWRWELMDGADVVGRGSFSVDGEPGYVNEIWGVTFEPPPGWELVSEQESFVTFSSPDQRRGLALRAILGVTDLSEIAAANLALFRADHPDAEVVATRETTMNGRGGLLQQVRAADPGAEDQESDEQLLFIASAIHGDAGYSLWVLGPADETEDLTRLLDTARLSVRFATD
jgi:hypothetical protein